MTARRTLSTIAAACLISLAASPALAVPFTAGINEFWIMKGAAGAAPVEIFRDSFTDGVLPPSGPDDGLYNPTTYALVGAGGFTSESGGKLTMAPASGDPTGISGAYSEYSSVAVRLLATNSANPNFLGQNSSFEIHGLFDMSVLPTIAGQSFGIRATDRAPALGNDGNETYSLFVGLGGAGPNAGQVVVALRLNDYVADVSTVLAATSIQALLANADQIELIFSKAPGAADLTASYLLYDAGHNVFASGSIGGDSVMSIYDGENYIRGGFQSTDVVPMPEPATVALLGLGFAGLSFVRKRGTPS